MVESLHIGSAVVAAFLASLVEAVEALTIVLAVAVAVVRGWRPAGIGALAGLALLAIIVGAFGPISAALTPSSWRGFRSGAPFSQRWQQARRGIQTIRLSRIATRC